MSGVPGALPGIVPRVVVVGTGVFGQRRGADLARRGTQVGFVSRDLERARAATGALGGPPERAWASLEGALAWGQAVFVATPPAGHSDAVLAAARAGRPVLVEKPVESSLPRGESLARALGPAASLVTVAENFAFLPALAALAPGAPARRTIGPLARVKVRVERMRAPGGWRRDVALAGGGPLMDVGVHYVSFLRALLGDLRVELAAAGPALEGGIEGSIELAGTSAARVPWELAVSWASRVRRSEVRLEGERGSLAFRAGRRWLWRLTRTWSLPTGLSRLGPDELGHEALLDDWLAAAEQGRAGRVDLASGLADLAVVEAAYAFAGCCGRSRGATPSANLAREG